MIRLRKIQKKYTLIGGFLVILGIVGLSYFVISNDGSSQSKNLSAEQCLSIIKNAKEMTERGDINGSKSELENNQLQCTSDVEQAKTQDLATKSRTMEYMASLAELQYVNGDKDEAKKIAEQVIEIDKTIDRSEGVVDPVALRASFRADGIMNDQVNISIPVPEQ